ncbi:MAG: 8-amino-7-oxononanoate synthase, partial [Chlorobium limicola]|nr:8-amino-7-oxononanoate synthase [Chlorobium limicola]
FEVPGESHIVPVITGTNQRALCIAAKLREAGVLGMAVRPPTVPENRARIRFSLRASLEWEDLEHIPELISGVLL